MSCRQLSICLYTEFHILSLLEDQMFLLSLSQICCGENTSTWYILGLTQENLQILSKMKLFHFLWMKHNESCPIMSNRKFHIAINFLFGFRFCSNFRLCVLFCPSFDLKTAWLEGFGSLKEPCFVVRNICRRCISLAKEMGVQKYHFLIAV